MTRAASSHPRSRRGDAPHTARRGGVAVPHQRPPRRYPVPGPSLKQAIAWTIAGVLLVAVATTALMLFAADVAHASDTSQKVGDEARGWLTVLFLVVAGFGALPGIGRLDVGRGFALAALVLILGGFAFAQSDVRAAIHSIWSSIG